MRSMFRQLLILAACLAALGPRPLLAQQTDLDPRIAKLIATVSKERLGVKLESFNTRSSPEGALDHVSQRTRKPAPTPPSQSPVGTAPETGACLVLERWMAQLDREYPSTNWAALPIPEGSRRGMMLFADESFIPYFQKPYDQMSREERRAAQSAGRGRLCDVLLRKVYGDWVTAQVRSGLGTTLPSLEQHLDRTRAARDRLATALPEIDALRKTPGSYERLDALETELTPQLPYLWERERTSFTARLKAARGGLAETALPERVNAALSGNDYPALVNLQALRQSLDRIAVGVDAATRQRYAAQLDARATVLLRELLAAERSALSVHGTGTVGLARDAEWHADFRERFAGPFSAAAEVSQLQQHFQSQRPARVAAAVPELTRLVSAAATHEAVDAILTRHLVFDADLDQRAVWPVLVASWDRKDQLRRASGISVAAASAAAPRPAAGPTRGTAAPARVPVTTQRVVYIRPTLTAVIHAQLRNAASEMFNARREKAAIADAIVESRRAFWSCNPNCQNVDEILKPYGYALWQKDMYYLFLYLVQAPPGAADIFRPETGISPELIDKMTGGKLDGGIPQPCDSLFARWMAALRRASGGRTVNGAYFPDGAKFLAALGEHHDLYLAYSTCRDGYEFDNRPLFTLTESSDPYQRALLYFYEALAYGEPHAKRLKESERLFEATAERYGADRVLTTAALMMQAAQRPSYGMAMLTDPASLGCTVVSASGCFRQLLGERPPAATVLAANVTSGDRQPPPTSGTAAERAKAGPAGSSGSVVPAPGGSRSDTMDDATLQTFVGTYEHRDGSVTVKRNGDTGLTLTLGDGRVFELEYTGLFRFAIKGVTRGGASFLPNASQIVVIGLDKNGIVGRRVARR